MGFCGGKADDSIFAEDSERVFSRALAHRRNNHCCKDEE